MIIVCTCQHGIVRFLLQGVRPPRVASPRRTGRVLPNMVTSALRYAPACSSHVGETVLRLGCRVSSGMGEAARFGGPLVVALWAGVTQAATHERRIGVSASPPYLGACVNAVLCRQRTILVRLEGSRPEVLLCAKTKKSKKTKTKSAAAHELGGIPLANEVVCVM